MNHKISTVSFTRAPRAGMISGLVLNSKTSCTPAHQAACIQVTYIVAWASASSSSDGDRVDGPG